jgi:hypothetical protein
VAPKILCGGVDPSPPRSLSSRHPGNISQETQRPRKQLRFTGQEFHGPNSFPQEIAMNRIATTSKPATRSRRASNVSAAADDGQANMSRLRVIAWLTRIAGELQTVGDRMNGEHFAGALSPEERKELSYALAGAREFINDATPRDVPAELAEDFTDTR